MTDRQLEQSGSERNGISDAHADCLLENDLLLQQLLLVQEEMEQHYLENVSLKKRYCPGMVSAVAQVKGELAYQYGSAVISSAKTVWKLFFLPVVFWMVARRCKQEQQRQPEAMPPLSSLPDFEASEKVRKHLSYRMGSAWLGVAGRPFSIFAIPWVLLSAWLAYRRDRKAADK